MMVRDRFTCVRRLPPLAIAALLIAIGSRRAESQYSVTQVQPLAFGYLTQGVTEVVPYTDTFRRGVVTIDGSGNAYVRVVMPPFLISATGATIPLQFLVGDVAAQDAGKSAQVFDPAGSTRVNLNKGTGSLLIGGRAVPGVRQLAGSYSATMVVIVSSTKF
jgi:hypothetical protein